MMSHSAAWGPRPEGTTPCCRVHSRAPWSPAESGPHSQSHLLWLLFLPSPAARTPSQVSRRITSSVNAGPRGSLWGSPPSGKTSSRKPELGSEYCGGGGEVKTVPGGRTGGGRTAAPKLVGGERLRDRRNWQKPESPEPAGIWGLWVSGAMPCRTLRSSLRSWLFL